METAAGLRSLKSYGMFVEIQARLRKLFKMQMLFRECSERFWKPYMRNLTLCCLSV